jgi:hypothetical protein
MYHFDVIRVFVIAENGRKTISAARGRVRPEVKSPFDSLTRFDVDRCWIFSIIFYLSLVIRLFDLHVKSPFKFWGRDIPR